MVSFDQVAHYPEYFERLRARGTTGEEKEFIARKEGVSEQELRSRFYDALPIIYLTALLYGLALVFGGPGINADSLVRCKSKDNCWR